MSDSLLCALGKNPSLRLHILEDGWIAINDVSSDWQGRARNAVDAVKLINQFANRDRRCPACKQKVSNE